MDYAYLIPHSVQTHQMDALSIRLTNVTLQLSVCQTHRNVRAKLKRIQL